MVGRGKEVDSVKYDLELSVLSIVDEVVYVASENILHWENFSGRSSSSKKKRLKSVRI